jgi:hypothetical protein
MKPRYCRDSLAKIIISAAGGGGGGNARITRAGNNCMPLPQQNAFIIHIK